MAGLFGEMLLIFVLVLLNAFLAASEIALVTARRSYLALRAEEDPDAAAALRLVENPSRLLATVQVGITLAGFFASAVGALSFVVIVSDVLERVPWEPVQTWSETIAIIAVTLVISFVSIVFGELIPKRLAIHYADQISLAIARPIEWLAVATAPIVGILSGSANLLLRVFGIRDLRTGQASVTEADLRFMFDVAAKEGEVELSEIKMLHRVFEFTDRLAKEVMTPRPEIQWVDKDETLKDLLTLFAETFHARYLLCDGEPDNILGVINMKDVLRAQATKEVTDESSLQQFMRPVLFVPETKRVGELFEEMRLAGHQMAVIVDEYGGTAGLVTLKQIIEEIMGRVGDETTGQEQEYESIDEHTFQVEGAMRVDEAREALGLNLPEGDYETVAGYLLFILGHIPQQGELVRYENFRLTVAEMSGVKIEKVLVTRT